MVNSFIFQGFSLIFHLLILVIYGIGMVLVRVYNFLSKHIVLPGNYKWLFKISLGKLKV